MADIKETKATIEERVKEGYKVVKAWVVFEDEQSRFDCMELVVKSEAEASEETRGQRTCAYLRVTHRPQLGARRPTPCGRTWGLQEVRGAQNLSVPVVLFAYLVFNVLTVALVQSQLRNPPEAICDEIQNGLVDNPHCPKIWDVESTNPVVRDLARRGLRSMQKPLVSYNQCHDYMDFKLFTGNATAYYGYIADHTRSPPPPRRWAASQAGDEHIQFPPPVSTPRRSSTNAPPRFP